MELCDLDDRNRDRFALPDHDVLVHSRLHGFDSLSHGPVLSLKWTLSGEEHYAFDGRQLRLRPGDVLLVPAGTRRECRFRARRAVDGRCLYLQASTLQAQATDELRALQGALAFPRAGDVAAPVLDALDADPARIAPHRIVAALRASLAARRERLDALPPRRLERRESIHQRLLRVRAHMHEHLDRPLPLATLAELACMSPFHFARHFRAAFGLPPHAYLLRLRLDTAHARLLAGRGSVGEIAAQVGMPDLQGFSRAFRRAHGIAPSTVLADKRARFA